MRRPKRFSLMMSEIELEVLGQLAESNGGLSKATMLRQLILRAANDEVMWVGKCQVPQTHPTAESLVAVSLNKELE